MGHSAPSLYRNTSRACPLTRGSLGRMISRGVRSLLEPFRDPRLRAAARALVLGLNGPGAPLVLGFDGDDTGNPQPRLWSDAVDSVRGPRGTVRLFNCCNEFEGAASADNWRERSSLGGIWSAGGIGRPRAAATI